MRPFADNNTEDLTEEVENQLISGDAVESEAGFVSDGIEDVMEDIIDSLEDTNEDQDEETIDYEMDESDFRDWESLLAEIHRPKIEYDPALKKVKMLSRTLLLMFAWMLKKFCEKLSFPELNADKNKLVIYQYTLLFWLFTLIYHYFIFLPGIGEKVSDNF